MIRICDNRATIRYPEHNFMLIIELISNQNVAGPSPDSK